MSDFLKFAYELLSSIVYNIADIIFSLVTGIIHLFITAWPEYALIFKTYFVTFHLLGKILSIILVIVLLVIPVLIIAIIIRKIIINIKLKATQEDNATLYREIGRLNKQVLDLMEEKNKILAMKVSTFNGAGVPYVGAAKLLDEGGAGGDVVPKGTSLAGGTAELSIGDETITKAVKAAAKARAEVNAKNNVEGSRFPKLTLVDEKYSEMPKFEFDNEISLQDFTENYRLFAASQMKLYYTPEIVRRFVAGMASSKILILEGISGTGKTSLPYSFSRYLNNPSTIVSVQPSFRDRTELIGYFNEFSKRFNETEFLRALYEANYREDPSFIVLDEMNLARIEYYFAEMLSVLEMPSADEWVLDLVPTEWPKDPIKLHGGKISIPNTIWFVGTANNDDSTFTITDKVYDRAIPIEINDRAEAFECDFQPSCFVTSEHLEQLFKKAKEDYPISESSIAKMNKLDQYLQTRFKLSFGNRIIKQMYDFVPVYVACGGTELGGMDYIIARKVLKKFESLNVSFVRDEIRGLIDYMEKLFGKTNMQDSRSYLERIQNLY